MRKIRFLCFSSVVMLAVGLIESADVNERTKLFPKAKTLQSVAETEKWVKKLVNSGVKMALPYLMSTATEVRLSSKCMGGLLKLMRGIMDISDWAVRMVDATGKPSAGILEGTATAMGDYDECIDIEVPKNTRYPPPLPYSKKEIDFMGQFCVIQIHIPEGIVKAAMDYQAGNRSNSDLANSKTFLRSLIKIAPRADIANYRFGVCIPSTCNKTDLQAIINEISKMIMVEATAMRCEIKESTQALGIEQYVILSFVGFIVLLIVIGTFIEMVIRLKTSYPIVDIMSNRSFWVQSILAFSAANNVGKLFSLQSNKEDKISCIRGIKCISVCLYVVVSTYASPHEYHFFKYRSVFHFYKFMEEWWFTVFANASAGIDTLFLVVGLQISYKLWNKHDIKKTKISIPKFIIKWYIRCTVCQLLVMALLFCLPLVGRGPVWADVVTPIIDNCKQRWWLNILYLSNFWSSKVVCLNHTWFICSLMHLFLLAPVVFWILSKWTSVGIFVNIILIMGSSLAIALVTLINDLPPAPAFYFLSFINLRNIWDKLFIQAYDHVAPFSIGMLLGYLFVRVDKIIMKKTVVVLGWCFAIAVNLAVICGLYGYRHGEVMEVTLSAVYASVHRLVWSLGTAWMVFACAYGYGGFVDKILSWKLFIPLNRIATLIYLLHPLVVLLHEGQLRERLYMGHLDQAMYAAAYIMFTLIIAALCYITCAAPFAFFEKKILDYISGKKLDGNSTDTPPNVKRKESKPTIIDIGLHINTSKYIENLKSKLEHQMETKTYQT